MNPNLDFASHVIAILYARGVKHFVVCAGSFNSPLVAAIANIREIQVYNYFEERSAAFFALGLSKKSRSPVVVCTTSGTAVAECLPAVIEAFYSSTPLIVLSADRESKLSGTGYPQSIEQGHLLSSHTLCNIDATHLEDLKNLPAEIIGPLHCNLRFSEPILPFQFDNPVLPQMPPLPSSPISPKSKEKCVGLDFLNDYEKILVIAENIPLEYRTALSQFLLDLSSPVLAEVRSGLRDELALMPLILKSQDLLLTKAGYDCVLRIGSVPSSDFWRSLERDPKLTNIPVYSLTVGGNFPGLSRENKCFKLEQCVLKYDFKKNHDRTWAQELLNRDLLASEKIQSLLNTYPNSEPALVNWFSRQIPADSLVYLGNSLPIREWNNFAERSERNFCFDANRGANGIDGQIASFLGASAASDVEENWALIGDLTFLYDCNSLGFVSQLPKLKIRLGLMQNSGGRIFEKLPYFASLAHNEKDKSSFINQHEVDCAGIAKAFGIEVLKVAEQIELQDLPNQVMLEIRPDLSESHAFWSEYKKIETGCA